VSPAAHSRSAPAPAESPEPAAVRIALPSVWLALICLAGAAHMALYRGPFDDAYISFRYARHVAEGLGYVYNPGERVEGFTCFGWVTLLAGVAAAGLPVPVVAVALSGAAAIALLLLTARLARVWSPSSPLWPLAAAVVAAHGSWAYFALTGMETTAFAALLTAALIACLRPGPRQGPTVGLLLAAATLMRPEGFGYFLLAAAVLASEWRRKLLEVVASYAAVIVPYTLWRWRYFGHLLPNTYYAKADGHGLLVAGWVHLEQFFTLHAFWLVPVALVVLVRRRGLDLGARLFAAWLAGAVVNVLLVGGDAFAFFRFFLPVIPVGAVLLGELVQVAPPRLRWAGAAALVAVTLAAELLPRVTLTASAPSNFRQVRSTAGVGRELVTIGRWLHDHLPPDTRLAVNPAGIIPYESGLPTIDMLGLTDAHIARQPLRVGSGARGHEKHDAGYVLDRRPDLIVPGLPALSSRPLRPEDLSRWFGRWFPFLPGDRELFASPRFGREYRGLSLAVAPGRYLTLFVRRDSFDRLFR
jgi:hypothetical protein